MTESSEGKAPKRSGWDLSGYTGEIFHAIAVSRQQDRAILNSVRTLADLLGAAYAAFCVRSPCKNLSFPFSLGVTDSSRPQDFDDLAIAEASAFQHWGSAELLKVSQHQLVMNTYIRRTQPQDGQYGELTTLIVSSAIPSFDEWGQPLHTVQYEFLLLCRRTAGLRKFFNGNYGDQFQEVPQPELLGPFMMLVSAFKSREAALSFFPQEFRIAAWRKVVGDTDGIQLPWMATDQPNGEIPGRRTITLSLDLRRSTLMMREAKDRKLFADWLEALVDILRQITHDNLGVFDKFTGDGVLVHFLVDEIAQLPTSVIAPHRLESYFIHDQTGLPPIVHSRRKALLKSAILALRTAQEMILAVQRHVEHAMTNIRFTSNQFGAAVGLAEDSAVWSMDRDGRPVVVGSGVVNACRLNSGAAGEIRMPNDLASVLSDYRPALPIQTVDLGGTHKDYPLELGITMCTLRSADCNVGRVRDDIQILVDLIWQETLKRDQSYSRLG